MPSRSPIRRRSYNGQRPRKKGMPARAPFESLSISNVSPGPGSSSPIALLITLVKHGRRSKTAGAQPRRRRCPHCHTLFSPDPRTRHRQRYCFREACRKASKASSQKRWIAKSGNRDYWRGPRQIERVRAWRRAHPGYWK